MLQINGLIFYVRTLRHEKLKLFLKKQLKVKILLDFLVQLILRIVDRASIYDFMFSWIFSEKECITVVAVYDRAQF